MNFPTWGTAPLRRTRFAPNVSGELHLGNVRTALVAYYYARGRDWRFDLRLDDDPINKPPRGSAAEEDKGEKENLIDSQLRWLGIEWDNVYRLSERLGLAYWAMDNVWVETGGKTVYPYQYLKDYFLLGSNTSVAPMVITSFFDDVFSGTEVLIRGIDLDRQERIFENALRLPMGPEAPSPFEDPEYKYLPVIGDHMTKWHKSSSEGITLTQCIEAGVNPEKLCQYLVLSLLKEKPETEYLNLPSMVESDDFWNNMVESDFTELNVEQFWRAMGVDPPDDKLEE